jgi:hypothetical protein
MKKKINTDYVACRISYNVYKKTKYTHKLTHKQRLDSVLIYANCCYEQGHRLVEGRIVKII